MVFVTCKQTIRYANCKKIRSLSSKLEGEIKSKAFDIERGKASREIHVG
jgi:hypothetical protein